MKLNAFVLVLSWCLTVAVALPSRGNASEIFINGFSCTPNNNGVDYSINVNEDQPGSGAYLADSGIAFLACPFPSGSEIHHDYVTYLSVSGNDSSAVAGLSATACVRDWATTTTHCGTSATSNTGGTGMTSVSPGLAAWNNGSYHGWFPYINVTLPATNSSLVGVYASQP